MCMSNTSLIVDASVQSVETREGVQTFTLTQNHRKGTRSQVSGAAKAEVKQEHPNSVNSRSHGKNRAKARQLEKPGGPRVGSGVRSDLKEAGMEDLQLSPRLYGWAKFL